MIYPDASSAVGRTPLVELGRLGRGLPGKILAKLEMASDEGILAGVSSGAAIHAALIVASRPEAEGTTIVVLLADTAERYISSALFLK